jgi:hypothetical protein
MTIAPVRARRAPRPTVLSQQVGAPWKRICELINGLRRGVLHHRSHLGTNTCGRIQLDRCCLVIRLQKVKPLAPDCDVYVDRIDCPTASQHPHRGRDCRRRARVPKVVICERKNNGSELDGPGVLRRGEGYHSPHSPCWAATGLLVDENGICT